MTASSKHRWAEHGGALVLCGRAGNSACEKLLGACANSTAFFFFFFGEKRMVIKDTVKDRTLVTEDNNNPTFLCFACCHLSGRAFLLCFKCKVFLAQSRVITAYAVCHQKKSRTKTAHTSMLPSSSP